MGRIAQVARGLRALEVTEERELAGRVAGLLYLTAALTVPLLLVVPGTPVDSVAAVLACSAFSLLWGVGLPDPDPVADGFPAASRTSPRRWAWC